MARTEEEKKAEEDAAWTAEATEAPKDAPLCPSCGRPVAWIHVRCADIEGTLYRDETGKLRLKDIRICSASEIYHENGYCPGIGTVNNELDIEGDLEEA